MDRCRVGFLQRHMVAHASRYDGVLAQVTRVLSKDGGDSAERALCYQNKGCCYASVITTLMPMPMGGEENEKEGGKKRPVASITLE